MLLLSILRSFSVSIRVPKRVEPSLGDPSLWEAIAREKRNCREHSKLHLSPQSEKEPIRVYPVVGFQQGDLRVHRWACFEGLCGKFKPWFRKRSKGPVARDNEKERHTKFTRRSLNNDPTWSTHLLPSAMAVSSKMGGYTQVPPLLSDTKPIAFGYQVRVQWVRQGQVQSEPTFFSRWQFLKIDIKIEVWVCFIL